VEQIIQNYIANFLGYGDPNNPFWFIGMEEGGGVDREELNARFNSWQARGAPQTDDLVGIANQIRIPRIMQWFRPQPVPLQNTWKKLIRIWLNAYAQEVSVEAIRVFQANCLGRLEQLPNVCVGQSPCLFEFLPLPSPGIAAWFRHYPDIAIELRMPFLLTRAAYRTHVRPIRIQLLQQILEHQPQPKIVCFYGMGYLKNVWEEVADVQLNCQQLCDANGNNLGKYCSGIRDGTNFIVSLHPTARGVPNNYFDSLGQLIHHLPH
jgi:hypothetical protein